MPRPVWYPHLTVAAIIEREGQFLCVEEHPRHRNVINQPAGHVEEDETILMAIHREVLEETGYLFQPQSLVGIYYFQGTNGVSYLRVCFCGEVTEQKNDGPIDPAITQTHWFSQDQLKQKKLRSPVVLDCLQDYLDGQRFPLKMIKEPMKKYLETV